MSYGDPYDYGYMRTEYAREKMIESYNGVDRWHQDESFKFKDMMYDKVDEFVKLTTDMDFNDGLLDYEMKARDIFDDIINTISSTSSARRSKKFTEDLLKTLGDILNPRKVA